MADLVSEADGWLKDRGPYNSAATEEMVRELRNALSVLLAAAEPFVEHARTFLPQAPATLVVSIAVSVASLREIAKAVEAVKGDGRG